MMAALKVLVMPILLGVVLAGCSSPRESTSGLPTVDVAAAGDTRADWPAAVADGALLARQQPLPVEVGVVVFNEGIRNPDAGMPGTSCDLSRRALRRLTCEIS